MSRIDLDVVERHAGHESLADSPIGELLAALVAELRAAYEVLDAAPTAVQLRALAKWLDLDDDQHGRADDQVQHDLRRFADALDAYAEEVSDL